MKRFALLGVLAFVAVGIVACGDDGNGAAPVGGENSSSLSVATSSSTVVESSSSLSSAAESSAAMSSSVVANLSSSVALYSSAEISSSTSIDTLRITYALKPFDGPLVNPHKGFTVPTEGTWVFIPEFEYGPYGSLNNKAWDLVTYGSGYQKWNKLNPAKDVYDWTELDKLLDALAEHNMGYALRVLPYSPSFVKGNDTPEED